MRLPLLREKAKHEGKFYLRRNDKDVRRHIGAINSTFEVQAAKHVAIFFRSRICAHADIKKVGVGERTAFYSQVVQKSGTCYDRSAGKSEGHR